MPDHIRAADVTLCFETGRETAVDLKDFLQAIDRPNVGVNFDPANMIIYGKGDPLDGVNLLMPWLRHVHAKDACKKTAVKPDTWAGDEVPLGQGEARLDHVIAALRKHRYPAAPGTPTIEQEAGQDRRRDVQTGIAFLRSTLNQAISGVTTT